MERRPYTFTAKRCAFTHTRMRMGADPTKPGVTVREDDIVYGYGNASGNEKDESQQGGRRDDLRVVRRRTDGPLRGWNETGTA